MGVAIWVVKNILVLKGAKFKRPRRYLIYPQNWMRSPSRWMGIKDQGRRPRSLRLKATDALFAIAKTWWQPKCPQMDEQIKCDVCAQRNYAVIKKVRKSYHLWQHGWPWRHYSKWNKLQKNKYCKISHACDNRGKEISLVVTRAGWEEGARVRGNWRKVSRS